MYRFILTGLLLFTLISFTLLKCDREQALPVNAGFEFEVYNNDYSLPVEIILYNLTKGAEAYQWEFEGGQPQNSSQRNPGVITFEQKGTYTITLYASNEDGSEDTISKTLVIDDPINIDFSLSPNIDFYSPSSIKVFNSTTNADRFSWTFQGGSPASSTEQSPPDVVFTEPGIHTITLVASNGTASKTLVKEIEVLPYLEANFDFNVAQADLDFELPVSVNFTNTSVSATSYSWSFTGANITSSTEANPNVIFNQVGLQTITLTATNGKETQTITQQIDIFANTNLYTHSNITLGINTAHNNNVIGAAYDLDNRQVFTKSGITETNGPAIDLVFFGLSNNFSRNEFVSPNNLDNTTFTNIPFASQTKIINTLENCFCGASLSVSEFDSMADDSLLNALNITETPEGNAPFNDSVLPRIVLFETADGRKGAIKIKAFINDSTNSYIEIDVKVQKVGF